MIYIKLDDDLQLIVTVKDTLRRGDSLGRSVIFLVPQNAGEIPTRSATIYLSYMRPDTVVDIIELERMEDSYDDNYDQYKIPVTCRMTAEAGALLMWMQIIDVSSGVRRIEKSGECLLYIEEAKDDDDYCDHDQIITALAQMRHDMDECRDEVTAALATKADGVEYNAETGVLQLMAGDTPVGDPVVIKAAEGKLIEDVTINDNGELIITFNDGTSVNLGVVVGSDGKVYVPHIDEHKVMTWTIEDEPGKIPDPVDMNPNDEWGPIDDESGTSDFIWEGI